MKKTFLAAAVAVAAATPAMAQNVTIYGRIDTGYNSLDITPAVTAFGIAGTQPTTLTGKTKGIAYGVDQTALWGFRGSEDLGGGLRASFVVETGLGGSNMNHASGITGSANNASGQTAGVAQTTGSRLLYAGISTSGGSELRVGYQSTLIRDVSVTYAADAATNVGGNLVAYGWAPRANAVTFMQTSGGLRLAAALHSQTTNTNAAGANDVEIGSGYALNLTYAAGPLSAAISYMTVDTGDQGVAAANKRESVSAGLSYDAKVAQFYAQYATLDNETGAAASQPEARAWNVGLRVPMGNIGLFASVSGGDNRQAIAGYKGDMAGYNVGARYNFSKRTTAYAILGHAKQETSATAETKVDQFGIGLTHVF